MLKKYYKQCNNEVIEATDQDLKKEYYFTIIFDNDSIEYCKIQAVSLENAQKGVEIFLDTKGYEYKSIGNISANYAESKKVININSIFINMDKMSDFHQMKI